MTDFWAVIIPAVLGSTLLGSLLERILTKGERNATHEQIDGWTKTVRLLQELELNPEGGVATAYARLSREMVAKEVAKNFVKADYMVGVLCISMTLVSYLLGVIFISENNTLMGVAMSVVCAILVILGGLNYLARSSVRDDLINTLRDGHSTISGSSSTVGRDPEGGSGGEGGEAPNPEGADIPDPRNSKRVSCWEFVKKMSVGAVVYDSVQYLMTKIENYES
ncbi:hypothetical protein [Kocuria tytonicola]|uniref:hypothetical protein n=1 Tax=Kocuria tytonicola TaxID=2055946 RepID=UPI000F53A9D8|nr:hypothetical protein [Kocuria tytonicola]